MHIELQATDEQGREGEKSPLDDQPDVVEAASKLLGRVALPGYTKSAVLTISFGCSPYDAAAECAHGPPPEAVET